MTQRLIFDEGKCTECRACELKCSFVHFEVFNPNKSGIRVVSDWPQLPRARLCVQCEDPVCVPACPVDALIRADEGVVKVLYDECIGCGDCVEACPYDGIWLDPLSEVAAKCDTCDGRFECVADCFVGALSADGKEEASDV
jgi:carbon-monoxide dehydrogenase iron sulfur subunit